MQKGNIPMSKQTKEQTKFKQIKSFDQIDFEVEKWIDAMIKKTRPQKGITINGK
jgi:hypothetical protein